MSSPLPPLTRILAAHACEARYGALPDAVRHEAPRALLNFVGCALGGCREPAVEIAASVAEETGGQLRASLLGRGTKTDIINAAFINCLSSAVHAFDDTHLATVTHPTGPVAAAILAWAELKPCRGDDFLAALCLGIEIQCRLSNLLLLEPAKANLSLYITGLTGPIGAAAAVGRLMGLDEPRMRWALGLAAAQAAGFRATHGAMVSAFPPAHAAKVGLTAALLAQKGLATGDDLLESDRGFVALFSEGADLGHAIETLGQRFEMLNNAYKPYPAGIVVHPLIDACLEIADQWDRRTAIRSVRVDIHPLAVKLADRPEPRTVWEAQISLQHWAAAALLRGTAGIAEGRQDCIDDPSIGALRKAVRVAGNAAIARDEAFVEVELVDGRRLRAHVAHARGSITRPMTDGELDAKFRVQARMVMSDAAADRLLSTCRSVSVYADVGRAIVSAITE